MKFLALHLPQYHSIPENDEWWGKGFTDWTNVKKARPLFEGHQQPIIPYKENYYNMASVSTLKKQAELSSAYGIDGFIYYHYWFNGKLLLEKPCELLLEHAEINQQYCFCWANETWSRTWSGKESEILIKQEFGGKEDWKKHIQYLLPFFKDPRYIYHHGKPVMFFYSCSRIEDFNDMISYWNKKLQKQGIPGIHIVEMINTFNSGKEKMKSNAIMEFEPLCTARYDVSNITKAKRVIRKKLSLIDFLSYDYVWECLLNKTRTYSKPLYRSAFVNFDNSARKGKKSLIMQNSSPEKFKKYLSELVLHPKRNYDDSFLIINAWNEWAEGAILEPTEKNKFKYLEAVKEVRELMK